MNLDDVYLYVKIAGAVIAGSIPLCSLIFGAYLKIRDRLTVIETKADILMMNIDGLGKAMGTEKSKYRSTDDLWADIPKYLNEKKFASANTKKV